MAITRMKILSAINKFHEVFGFSSAVHILLKKLKVAGKILWNPTMPKALRVINKLRGLRAWCAKKG